MTIDEARARIPEYRTSLQEITDQDLPYPANRFAGRGIVICAGGPRYLPPAWVCIRMLRLVGCTLPIELWHVDSKEMPARYRHLVEPFGVRCVNASAVREYKYKRSLNGWELKPFALLYCRFSEVLLLDADNVPILDPTPLFDAPEFRKTGAVFWPDFGRLSPTREIWDICRVTHQDEPEFESGQILIEKPTSWKALQLAMHMGEQSDFYYQFIHGDKDTFHMAWRKLGRSYAMPSRPLEPLRHTMCQHDFNGRRMFQHRNLDKWRLDRENPRISGFEFEDECRAFLKELALLWHRPSPGVFRWHAIGRPDGAQALVDELLASKYVYHRVGYDFRPLDFRHDGRIGLGAAARELYWDIREISAQRPIQGGNACDLSKKSDAVFELIISGQLTPTCALAKAPDGVWRGRWLDFEKMRVELTPQPPRLGRSPARQGHTFRFVEKIPRLLHQIWLGSKPYPVEARHFAEGWRRAHPKWHYQLWTEREIIGWNFAERELFDRAVNPAMRSDILRYVILQKYGGLYFDTDFECLRPLDDLLPHVDADSFAGFEPPTVNYRWSVSNALLGSLPGSPFIRHLLEKLPESIAMHIPERALHGPETIPRCTGPGFVTRNASLCQEITIFPQPVLYPYPSEVQEAHARHHFRGSWRGLHDYQRASHVRTIASSRRVENP